MRIDLFLYLKTHHMSTLNHPLNLQSDTDISMQSMNSITLESRVRALEQYKQENNCGFQFAKVWSYISLFCTILNFIIMFSR